MDTTVRVSRDCLPPHNFTLSHYQSWGDLQQIEMPQTRHSQWCKVPIVKSKSKFQVPLSQKGGYFGQDSPQT